MQRRPRNKVEANRQGRRLAEQVRDELDLGSAEVRDLAALMETHFAVDVALSPLGNDVDGLCAHADGRGLIVASSNFPEGHIRFTLAHELGHHLLADPRDVIDENFSDMNSEDMLERRVNAFAAHLLMPMSGLDAAVSALRLSRNELSTGSVRGKRGVAYLARLYGVSPAALLFQLVELKLIPLDEARALACTVLQADGHRRGLLAYDIPEAGAPFAEATNGTVRPPRRLLDAALEGARAGVIGTGSVAILLEREDDDSLFDEVLGPFDDGLAEHA